MGIPIIDEITTALTGLFNGLMVIIPNYFKPILFLAVVALFISLLGFVFNVFNLPHPRILQPAECLNMTTTLIYQLTFNETTLSQCLPLSNCINTNQYVNQYNVSVLPLSILGQCACNCVTHLTIPTANGSTTSYTMLECTDNYLLTNTECQYRSNALRSNVSIFDFCVNKLTASGEFNLITSTDLYNRCRTAGIDLLDSTLIWAFTLICALVSFTWWYYSNTISR